MILKKSVPLKRGNGMMDYLQLFKTANCHKSYRISSIAKSGFKFLKRKLPYNLKPCGGWAWWKAIPASKTTVGLCCVTAVKQSGIHLHKVILYGSYAQNKQHKWSDIDIALVADEFMSIGFEDVKLFAGILIKYANLNIQPRTYNTKDFSTDKDPFVQEILNTGIEIET